MPLSVLGGNTSKEKVILVWSSREIFMGPGLSRIGGFLVCSVEHSDIPKIPLRDRSWVHEMGQVVRAAGFRAPSRQAEAAEGLPADHGPGYRPIEVEIAHAEPRERLGQVARIGREHASGERVRRRDGQVERMVEVPGPHHGEHGAEEFVLGDAIGSGDISDEVSGT